MFEEIFKFKRPNFEKLIGFGFEKNKDKYSFCTSILDNEFLLTVAVTENQVSTKLVDKNSQEEYVLHLLKDSQGEFVGNVRSEIEKVLKKICENCFETDIFKGKQAKQLIEYVRAKYADDLEFLWEKSPNCAIWRRKDNKKWYGIIMQIEKSRLGLKSQQVVEIVNFKLAPDEVKNVVNGKTIFTAYHMNKKHWISICLDFSLPTNEVCKFLDLSYIASANKT